MKESVELWTELLSFYMNFDSMEIAINTFQIGVQYLTSKSLPLWQIMILYMQNTHPKLVCFINLY